MRTPQQAYDEAMLILEQRIGSAEHSMVSCKPSYRVGLRCAIEQLRMSFYGVFDVVALTQPLHESEAERLAQPNVGINLTLPKGHPERHQTRLSMESGQTPGKEVPERARLSSSSELPAELQQIVNTQLRKLFCDECGDTNLVEDSGNGNPGWYRCHCGNLHQHAQVTAWISEEPAAPAWSFEAHGSENDNSEGWLHIPGKPPIQLLAESCPNLVRILLAELKSYNLQGPTLEEALQLVEHERGFADPWNLQLDADFDT